MKHAQDELVAIDSHGIAHPVGLTAGEQMRRRKERHFRLMPTPDHVIFLRYTGEDGRRDEEDGAVIRLAGEITAPGALCDVLALVAQAGWRGELTVRDGEHNRSVFIEGGNAVSAITDVEEERIGRIMYRFGAVDEMQHRAILERCQQSAGDSVPQKYGEIGIELGFVTQKQVYTYLARQVEEVLLATMTVADGMYCFLDGFDENALMSRHSLSLNGVLMDGVTRMDEMRYFRQRIPSADYVPERAPNRGEPGKEFLKVWEQVDGLQSVGELGRALGLGEFETTKQLFQLVQSKHVTMQRPRLRGGPIEVVETANAVLREIHQEADTAGKGTVLRTNLASFADGTYEVVFQNAGPGEKGVFDVQQVVNNARMLAAGANVEKFLKELMYDYVSFALFTAGSLVRRAKDQGLGKQVEPLMSRLRPIG
jgi:hypothetical protein